MHHFLGCCLSAVTLGGEVSLGLSPRHAGRGWGRGWRSRGTSVCEDAETECVLLGLWGSSLANTYLPASVSTEQAWFLVVLVSSCREETL